MKRLFVEAELFRKKIDKIADLGLLKRIQTEILKDPNAGDVIRGTSGVRKLRISDESRSKGKRGGFRIIYLDLPAADKTYLLWIYGKNEADDLSAGEKKIINQLVTQLKKEVQS